VVPLGVADAAEGAVDVAGVAGALGGLE